MSRKVWMNGKFVPEGDAKLSIYDSALMFGDMVFEMTRSFNKLQFRLRQHLERLYRSMKYLHIDCGMSIDDLEIACYETIEENNPYFVSDDEHRLMINVSRGALSLYSGIDGIHKGPNIMIADFPLRWTVQGMGKLFETGVNAVIPSQRTIPASLLDPKIKNRSRIHYQMANIEVSKSSGANNWALLLDPDGFIAEGSGANFFIVKGGRLLTPEGRNILRGISRDYVMELCNLMDDKFILPEECNLELYDVLDADEAFFTATPFCILPVTSINGIKINDGKVGELTHRLLNDWGNKVGVNIVKQIQKWDAEYTNKDVGVSPYSFKK